MRKDETSVNIESIADERTAHCYNGAKLREDEMHKIAIAIARFSETIDFKFEYSPE